jgi:hypothetical protein
MQILHPKIFIYNCVNLPLILSKLLQAQLRNVAGSLELDQMIQDAATVSCCLCPSDSRSTARLLAETNHLLSSQLCLSFFFRSV